jgi:hypothetical protein
MLRVYFSFLFNLSLHLNVHRRILPYFAGFFFFLPRILY